MLTLETNTDTAMIPKNYWVDMNDARSRAMSVFIVFSFLYQVSTLVLVDFYGSEESLEVACPKTLKHVKI